MQVYDPTVEPRRTNAAGRAPALVGLQGKTIGVLHNGKLNAPEMLSAIAKLFEERDGCTILPLYAKQNASAPAPSEVLEKAAQEVDFLITGLGD